MRWLVLVALAACAAEPGDSTEPGRSAADATWPDDALEQGRRYLRDRGYRRSVLEGSLVDPTNLYSALRLANYAREDGLGWDAAPVWNPGVRPVRLDELDDGDERGELRALELPSSWDGPALRELGRRAFEQYPLQVTPAYRLAIEERDQADRYGLWIDDRGRVGGLVWVELDDGELELATTCASCHGRVDGDGVLVHGAASPRLDQGAMFHDYGTVHGNMPPSDELLGWGPGHVDPTEDGVDNPTGIPDLRPVRYQNHLNAAATLRNSFMALTVRTETLLITGAGAARRPPRLVPLAIAYYLWSLGAPAEPGQLDEQERRGRDYFELVCDRCHHADGTTEAPVELDEVGTDPATGLSPFRGTGYYRIPSLFKVGDRQRLLHRSFLGSLEEMFDPDRLDAVSGHPFGLDLTDDERADLLAYVRTIGWR